MKTWLRTVLAFGSLLFAGQASAAEQIDVKTAHERAKAGETLLIDIRTPQEWRATGVPADATLINLHDENGPAGFVAKMRAAVGDDLDRPIALICRSGNRSRQASGLLAQAGFTAIADVRGGVAGGPGESAEGWFDAGLPVRPCDC